MQKCLFFIVFMCLSASVMGQNYDLPPNAKAGKCYEKCFEYDKKLTWKEVDCNMIAKKKKQNESEIIETQKAKIKLRKYQEKLLVLGFDVNVNGILDKNTIDSHHEYLKKKQKAERKEKRQSRRKS